ncbi:MAG: hypothetical protein K6U14_07290 [Firmicutes bacterium]|nr:hypothetical protein [Alicyclobacillaceae bacterium]MCL6497422.1 hypothetical protein [Bacillota bacterium]
MRHVGRLRLHHLPERSEDLPTLQIEQVWPDAATFSVDAAELARVVDRSRNGWWRKSQTLSAFLAETTVTYEVDGEGVKHLALHPVPAADGYEWCPVIPASTPFAVESYLAEHRERWRGPVADPPPREVRAIAEGKVVRGLTLKKQGTGYYLAVRQSPVTFENPPADAIREEEGWFLPRRPQGIRMSRETNGPVATAPAEKAVEWPLPAFLNFVRRRGLVFDPDDLVLFLASLAAGQFVVLSGTGGLGKSSLALALAGYLECRQSDSRLAWLTVEPSWVSSEQVIGHYDPTARLFRPALGNLVNVLLHAAEYPALPHVVCLDELNLARVEHYLAPWLSLWEHPADTGGWPLYPPDEENSCLNRHRYPPRVSIGKNLYWIGTVNLDEASHGLTDKFLDRVTYIVLRHARFQRGESAPPPPLPPVSLPLAPPPAALSAEEYAFFDRLNAVRRRPLVGWRALDAMRAIVGAVPAVAGPDHWTAAKAWDEVFAARVLSRFRGAGIEWEYFAEALPALRGLLQASPWGALERSLAVLEEIQEMKEAGLVL